MSSVAPDNETYRRKHLAEEIDRAVEREATPELLGRLVKQQLNLRYFGRAETRTLQLVEEEIRRHVRGLIANQLQALNDELMDHIEERIKEHLPDMARACADAFIEDLAKGR
jgi:hypothetical protein